MSFSVVLTDAFKRNAKKLAKKYPSLGKDISGLIKHLEIDPYQGVRLSAKVFKIRVAITSKGRGKSGGGRVIYYYPKQGAADEVTIYFITIYDKSAIKNIPDHIIDSLIRDAGIGHDDDNHR